jgi:Domain of unknown function (DUF397)
MSDRTGVQRGWRTSSYSGGGNNCAEVAAQGRHTVAVRDSQDPAGPRLVFSQRTWEAFISRAKRGIAALPETDH